MAKLKKGTVSIVPDETIIRKIYMIRGQKVMLDYDLAALYGVGTKALNQAVKRNIDKFPEDFMFRLSKEEWDGMRSQFVTAYPEDIDFQTPMRSQFVTSSQSKRNTEHLPYAFTEHGIVMLAFTIKSEQATKMCTIITRAFVALRKSAVNYEEITRQLEMLRQRIGEHDVQLNQIYDTLENLLDEKATQKNWEDRTRIGYK